MRRFVTILVLAGLTLAGLPATPAHALPARRLIPCAVPANGDITFATGASYTIDTATLTIIGVGGTGVVVDNVAVFSFNSIDIQAGASVLVTGSRPLALLSRTSLIVNGDITVAPGTTGGGAGGPLLATGQGTGGGLGGSGFGGGGGAGYGGVGGSGAANGGGAGGPIYGDLLLNTFAGGSGGGGGRRRREAVVGERSPWSPTAASWSEGRSLPTEAGARARAPAEAEAVGAEARSSSVRPS